MSVPCAARSSRRRCRSAGRRVVLHDAVVLERLVDRRLRRWRARSARRASGASTAPTTAGRLASRSSACVRRDERRRTAPAMRSGPLHAAALDAQPRERPGEIGNRVGPPGVVAARGGAHRGDARVLAVETGGVRRRRERAHVLGAEVRRRESGDDVERARELENVQRVRVHGRCFLTDPRTRAVGVRLSSSGTLVPPAPRARWR